MPIAFSNPSNRDIDTLVEVCFSKFDPAGTSGLLVTPPLDELVPESEPEDEYVEPADSPPLDFSRFVKAYPFTSSKRKFNDLIVAVDSGVLSLGQLSGGGTAFAIRGAATCYTGNEVLVLSYNTGALVITPQNKVDVFEYIGTRIGKPDLYVQVVNGALVTRPSAADTQNQIQDRCRSFVERMIQEEAIGLLAGNGGGLLLVDGALTVSYDTPRAYLSAMLTSTYNHAVDVCAISKRSRITIGGMPIDTLFDPYPTFVGYAPLLSALRAESAAYAAGTRRAPQDMTEGTEIYAARFGFGPPALTFRVDTARSGASLDEDVINDVYNKSQIYGGYPKPLIDAHQYSSFLGGEALTLLADLVVRTNLRVREEQSMSVLFQPFGAFGK
ncbi:MAG TPA: hypothetical protein VF952_09035 [Chloroflexia bacterium]|jgi:hypothetical protein